MNSDQPAGSALRLLVAFTLGMLAMAAIAVVVMLPMLRSGGSSERAGDRVEEEGVATATDTTGESDIDAQGKAVAPTASGAPRGARPSPSPVTDRQRTAEGTRPPQRGLQKAENETAVVQTVVHNAAPAPLIYADTPDAPRFLNVGGAWREVGGVISGKVTLKGNQPRERQIAIPGNDPCGKLPNPPTTTRIYRVGADNGLADVTVYLSEGVRGGPWALNAKTLPLFYTGCRIEPYVSGIQVGQKLLIHNLDEIMHNAHFTPNNRANKERNYAFMPRSTAKEMEISVPEMFARFKCDMHPWEFGYVSVFDHPFFAVTTEDGLFQLEGIPPGEYVLTVTHRKSGSQAKRVRVQHNVPNEVNFSFETVEL